MVSLSNLNVTYFPLKMEGHKEETNTFFTEHCLALNKLQENITSVLAQLQNECESLKEETEVTKLALTEVSPFS